MAQRELDKIVQRLRDDGIKAESLLKVGSPFLEIIHASQTENADLIVLGTHGRTGTCARPDGQRRRARGAESALPGPDD